MKEQRAFPCRRESVKLARRFARETLGDEPADTLEAVELMVSELATNCVQHARSDFEIAIELSPGEIRVEARDGGGGGQPTRRSPSPREPTGRGLLVVEALSDAWGVERRADGKTVWFSLGSGRRSSGGDRRLGRNAA
jgi:anti-sigma regulatory factor (Ser/Thr protein kinase)